MNNLVKSFLITALAVSAAQVQAHTNKTFLMPRPAGINLPMSYTTFNELAHREDPDKFGGNFQVTGFYQASTDSARIGRYFGIRNRNIVRLHEEAKVASAAASTVTDDLDLGYILHDFDSNLYGVARADKTAQTVSIKLNPEQIVYGARFDYYQDLEKILKGLYLAVALPVVHVENNMKLKVSCGGDALLNQRIIDYFKGCRDISPNNSNKQAVLTKARINGTQSTTGVADIDMKLGYNFLNNENYHVGLNAGITFPTGNEAKGDYVFEPIHGNGQHWGLGFGLDSTCRVWHDDKQDLKLAVMFNYRYLFKDTERRTLGINDPNAATTGCRTNCGNARPWGQYHLLGDKTITAATNPKVLIPAANLTTLAVDVTPGSQFDGIVALAYNNGNFSVDLGYNLYLREGENVKLKGGSCNAVCINQFENDRYFVVARSYNTANANAFGDTAGAAGHFDGAPATPTFLKASDINTCVAETPSQNSHKIFTGLGYIFKEWDNPLMLGAGGSYEWANSGALDQWALWLKLGIGF